MMLFYIPYGILMLILTPIILSGQRLGCLAHIMFFIVFMAFPIITPIGFSLIYAPKTLRTNLFLHFFTGIIVLIWLCSLG
ncbi:MAG: hypothetical protein PUK16_07375 [Prevotellaceae bacterium]|nr:hypothetical protein [Prevotellaceae bacterium]